MTSNPILPIVPEGAAPVDDSAADDETLLQVNNPELDEGETTDGEDAVEEDLREGDEVNERLDE